MTIIEVPQGRYDLSGKTKAEAVSALAAIDELWRELDAPEHSPHSAMFGKPPRSEPMTAPFGFEWYVVDADGRLQRHSAQYDSNG